MASTIMGPSVNEKEISVTVIVELEHRIPCNFSTCCDCCDGQAISLAARVPSVVASRVSLTILLMGKLSGHGSGNLVT